MTASSYDGSTSLELRVLEGPQAGARAPLLAGLPCELATGADLDGDAADIVLRDGASAARVRITVGGTGQALLEVLHGGAALGAQALATGAGVAWPMHAPLALGGSVVAFGCAGDADWPAAPAAAAAASKPPAAVPAARRGMPWLLTLGLVVALGSSALLALVHLSAGERPRLDATPLAAALQGSEFSALTLGQDADGRPRLRGRLATLAERARLDAWMAQRNASPAIEVQVDEALARDVTETFRINGVAVTARVHPGGRVAAEANETDAARLARAEEVVQRDVRGLRQLDVVNRAQPVPPPSPPLPDDPGKRIASLVPGEPAYLVTADGSRYFVGALLPSGHRITQIADQRVTLERDGRSSTLNL